ncbi:NnrS family protein [Pseudoalteromonas sp. YIC-656]|uniref:NnrS family protein n=1 Tax=Pseudoalteromonas pernae TaxID=3118054 RepID=UPI003241FFCD
MAVLLPSGQIAEPSEQARGWPFMRLAFRPLFWLGALFAMLSIPLWALTYTGNLTFTPFGSSHFWHIHEMLFGFAVAIITGFLLTAVQNWSGVPSVKGKPLFALVLIWLSARLLMAFPHLAPNWVIMTLDLAYLPLAAFFLAIPIIKAALWRNLFFIPILLAMSGLNALMYTALYGHLAINFLDISHVMVMMITLVMVIMGGRVFPMFTANGTHTQRIANIPWLDKASIISVLLCVALTLIGDRVAQQFTGSLFLIAGVLNFIRALRWRIWVTFGTALVWPLHASYWALCCGLVLMGAYHFGWLTSISTPIHAITVGGMGLMILAMISRVSLGHTGRMIKASKPMSFAFLLMVVTLLVRLLASLTGTHYSSLILLSAALWAISYALFVIGYGKIVFSARIDGRDG